MIDLRDLARQDVADRILRVNGIRVSTRVRVGVR
jgi:hypothetical protein